MDSWLVLRSKRVILNQWTKWSHRSCKWLPRTSFMARLPIRQEILNVSQIGVAFHGTCPPTFIQTCLHQYYRGTFFHSAYCSLSNPICFWSVWRGRAMIPGKIFTGFAEFQGIVSVNDFRLFRRLPEQKPCCVSWEVLVLHGYDWIHWVAMSCTTTAHRWLFRDHNLHWELWSAVVKSPTFLHDSANTSSARGLCDFGPLTDLAISVFREVSKNTVFK